MRLFIRLQNGQPLEHPILEDNMCQAFPEVDLDNLPDTFAEFIRYPKPTLAPYEVYEGVVYSWVDGKVQDVHNVRSMTQEEKTAKQDQIKAEWAQYNGFASWVFNEVTCSFDPPTPYPEDGKDYRWDEPTISWVEVT